MRVTELMTRDVVSVLRDTSLDEAMDLMDDKGIRHLPVVDGDRLAGELSERDLLEVTGWLPKRVREVLEAPAGTVGDFMHAPVVTVSPQDTVVTACVRFTEWNIGCLPVLDDGTLVGMLTDSDVMQAYTKACAGASLAVESDPRVEEVMTIDVLSADHRTPAEEALEFCRTKELRHLPLIDGDELVGMVTDRDLRLSVGRGQLEGTPVGELGATELVTVEPDTRLSRAAELLLANKIGAIPVVDGGRMVGMVTSADVLNHCTQAFATPHGPASA